MCHSDEAVWAFAGPVNVRKANNTQWISLYFESELESDIYCIAKAQNTCPTTNSAALSAIHVCSTCFIDQLICYDVHTICVIVDEMIIQ